MVSNLQWARAHLVLIQSIFNETMNCQIFKSLAIGLLLLSFSSQTIKAQVSSFSEIKKTDPELYKYVYAMHKKHNGAPWHVTFATPKTKLYILRAPVIDSIVYDPWQSATAIAYEDGRVFVKVKLKDGLTYRGLEFTVFQIGVTSEEWSAFVTQDREYFSRDVGIDYEFGRQVIVYSPSEYGMGLEEYLSVVERQFGTN